MVLGAQGDQMAEGANGSPDNSGAQTTREPRQLGSPDNLGAQENLEIFKKITLKIALFDPNFPQISRKHRGRLGG